MIIVRYTAHKMHLVHEQVIIIWLKKKMRALQLGIIIGRIMITTGLVTLGQLAVIMTQLAININHHNQPRHQGKYWKIKEIKLLFLNRSYNHDDKQYARVLHKPTGYHITILQTLAANHEM